MRTIETTHNGVTIVEVIMEDIDFSSNELKNQRLSICKSCEFIINNDACGKCSCLLVNRILYVESFCPVGKW